MFIAEFVERLPIIFPVNIWGTYLFKNDWCRILRPKECVGSVIQWSVFRSRRSVNRWILVQSGFDRSLIWKWISSKGTPQIRNPDPDSHKGTHPKIFSLGLFMEKIKMSCCIPFPVSSISVPVHSFSDVLKYHRLNQSELSFEKNFYFENVLLPLSWQSIPLTTPQVGIE